MLCRVAVLHASSDSKCRRLFLAGKIVLVADKLEPLLGIAFNVVSPLVLSSYLIRKVTYTVSL